MRFSQSFLDIASVILAVAVIIFVVWRGYRQGQMRVKTVEGMGFRSWKEVDTRFSEAVRSLVLHTHPERLVVQQAFWQVQPDMRLVLFDLVDKKMSASNVRSKMLAVYWPGIDLPEFRLFPQGSEFGEGRQANTIKNDIERLTDFALERYDERPIDFSDQPEIADRFTIIGRDEARVRSILTPERLQRLTSLPPGTVLQAGGDLILVGRLFPAPQKRPWEEQFRERIDMANQAAQILLR